MTVTRAKKLGRIQLSLFQEKLGNNRRFPRSKSERDRFNVLFLIPHPFFQDRGSPIADDLVLKVLSERNEQVDVVAYPEGTPVHYKNVNIHRTLKVPFVKNVRPGFSWKKLIYDGLMVLTVIRLLLNKRYHLVHAVEETVFIALLLKLLFNIPYVYDMDSSVAQQMIEKYPSLAPLQAGLNYFEKIAVKNAKVVVPVCKALADDIARYRPKNVVVLPDISLLKGEKFAEPQEDLRESLNIKNLMVMYVGNLESYQGIDLLLDSFAIVAAQTNEADLVVVGGDPADIQKYQAKAKALGITQKVHFVGTRPSSQLTGYLAQADILVSPRIKGKNTPMKIYSYLDSGKAVMATDLPTHTQVLTPEVARLAPAKPGDFAAGLLELIEDAESRSLLGRAGKNLIQEKHTFSAFSKKLNALYDNLKEESFLPPPDVVVGI